MSDDFAEMDNRQLLSSAHLERIDDDAKNGYYLVPTYTDDYQLGRLMDGELITMSRYSKVFIRRLFGIHLPAAYERYYQRDRQYRSLLAWLHRSGDPEPVTTPAVTHAVKITRLEVDEQTGNGFLVDSELALEVAQVSPEGLDSWSSLDTDDLREAVLTHIDSKRTYYAYEMKWLNHHAQTIGVPMPVRI